MNCHNGAAYLEESLTSILKQSYKQWELIFFDNKSDDNSKKIFLSFKDKRLKYFYSSKFINLYRARNLAIEKSKGQFIAFLDTDDLWVKDKLEKQIKKMKHDNTNFLYSNYYIKNNNKVIVAFKKKKPEGFITNKLIGLNFIGILTVIFKKEILIKHKIKFNNTYNIIGDFDYFVHLSKRIRFSYLHEPLAIYRVHKKNFSLLNTDLYLKELTMWQKMNKKKFKKEIFQKFILNRKYITIKVHIINRRYKKALLKFMKYPFSLKKIKLFTMFLWPKKHLTL